MNDIKNLIIETVSPTQTVSENYEALDNIESHLKKYHLHNMASEVFNALGMHDAADEFLRQGSDHHSEAVAHHKNYFPNGTNEFPDRGQHFTDLKNHTKKMVHRGIQERLT